MRSLRCFGVRGVFETLIEADLRWDGILVGGTKRMGDDVVERGWT